MVGTYCKYRKMKCRVDSHPHTTWKMDVKNLQCRFQSRKDSSVNTRIFNMKQENKKVSENNKQASIG